MFRLNWKKWHIGMAALLGLVMALPAWAQLDTGSIVGVVRDTSGAVVPGAKVTVTNSRTGRAYKVQTSSAGEYEVPVLPASTYKLVVECTGFKTQVTDGIVLYATDRRAVDVTLSLGQVTEQVTVTAVASAVNTQTSETGASIDSNKVSNLPLNGRDFTDLIALAPGAVNSGGFGHNSLGGNETSYAGVNVLLDGADATRIDSNATSTQLGRQDSRISRASVDSIQEFKVLSGTYSAEYGRSMGDVINVITKSGGNTVHGTVFDYFRNDALDASNFFATKATPLRLNQFGGNVSGPMVKNKLFFFTNYEGIRQIVETPTGNVAVVNAATRAKFVSSMDPVRDAIPLPNSSEPVTVAYNGSTLTRTDLGWYQGNLRNTLREDTGSVKIDYNAGVHDSFALRYNIDDNFTSTQTGIAVGQTSPSDGRNHLIKATWNHIFRPNLLNEFGVAFNRPKSDSLGGGGAFETTSIGCSSFWGCNSSNDFYTAPGPALFSNRRPQHALQFLDTMHWIKGKHTVAAGLDIRHVVTHSTLDVQRFLYYADITDFLNNNGIALSTLGYDEVAVQDTNFGFFVQDDFRMLPRLTVNLGLRYEYNSVMHGGRMGNFDVATLSLLPEGKPLYKPDRNNFAPRVGLAWDVFGKGKTVVRSGFGVFYSPLLTGAALPLAGNYQQSFSVNALYLAFGLTTCTPALTIAYPLPATLPTCTPALPANVNALDQNMRDTYSMHWSFGVQQELARNTVLEVNYVGNRGVKLPAGSEFAGLELNLNPFGANRLSTSYSEIRRLGDFLDSNYSSLQASLRRRLAEGLNLDANYTWAHEIDDGVDILSSAFQNSADPKGDYSDGNIDVRHNFTLGLVYDLPTASWVPKRVAKGWQVSSILQARSGLPFNIALASPFLGEDQARPNLVAGQSIRPSNYSVPDNQINASAFSTPTTYGNLGRNAGRGPRFTQIDFSISKTSRLNERLSLQIRGEMFNILNHPNFANPDGIMADANFGKSTSTIGNLVGTGTSRQAQFVVKLLF